MKRSERIETVARIRELQEQLAEQEAARRRQAAEERRRDAERAVDDVAARHGIGLGAALSFTELAHRRTSLEAAVVVAEQQQQRRDRAQQDLEHAQADWFVAHGRSDAADRLLDRALEGEAAEADRRERVELDDLVAARHRRTPNSQESNSQESS